MWAIVGGSGFENFPNFNIIDEIKEKTPYGPSSSGLYKVEIDGKKGLFLSRHGKDHELLPSDINYRANIFALKKLGTTAILAISSVGSLKEEYSPGDLVLPNQYVNMTKGNRAHTFCEQGVVAHVPLAKPTDEELTSNIFSHAKNFSFNLHHQQTYVCIDGPCFSTKAESHMYRKMGFDIIGMTNFPEYALSKEAGIRYVPCCFVTDYDCWNEHSPHVDLQSVITLMKLNKQKAFDLIQHVFQNIPTPEKNTRDSLNDSMMTPKEHLNQQQKEILAILTE
jgi:5'-methylthioadenosine phosphorylase